MATHCSVLAWRIPETAEPGGLPSMGLQSRTGLKQLSSSSNIQKTEIMASGPITSWQIDGETVETVADFIFLCSKIIADGDCSHEIK